MSNSISDNVAIAALIENFLESWTGCMCQGGSHLDEQDAKDFYELREAAELLRTKEWF